MSYTKDKKFELYYEMAILKNKNIIYDEHLYKIVKVSSMYIYVSHYKSDKALSFNDDIIFRTIHNSIIYKHYLPELQAGKPTKLLISKVHYLLQVVDYDNFNNIYFVFNKDRYGIKFKIVDNYILSEFFNETYGYLKFKKYVYNTFRNLTGNELSNKDNAYNYNIRKEVINNFFENEAIRTNKQYMTKILNTLNEENDNFCYQSYYDIIKGEHEDIINEKNNSVISVA